MMTTILGRSWLGAERTKASVPNRVAQKRFHLIRSFSFLGFICILLMSVMTSQILARFLERQLLLHDAAVMQQFVERIAQHHDPRGYFAQSYSRAGESLNDFFEDIAHMPDVARINAYSPAGMIVWSSDKAIIGRQFDENDELEEALRGELVYEKGEIDEHRKSEHVPFQQDDNLFVENYIPITDLDTHQIVGVVEIYRIPVALAKAIKEGTNITYLSVFAGGVFLYLALFWIVRRAHRLIDSQQETLLRQTRLATIGEMASSVAHSIRNPIASIRSSAELALEDCKVPAAGECLEDIIGEVDRFNGWIRELLTFAADGGEADGSALLSEVVEEGLHDFQHRAQRQGVSIDSQVSGGLPPVRGEPGLLVQVVNSLVANALDAMPEGGHLRIEASHVGERVRLTLADSGFGIPADRLEGLFDPLVTHKPGGLGIGLALARQIVQRNGGQIDLSSQLGQGTTVVVELPLAG
ncbi:MAG: hypothetical protein KDH88_00870 [Chromatiales bacterium]|nr:hypothetical protein [Chromatiales bacterium]